MIVFFSKDFEKSFDKLKDSTIKKRLQRVIYRLEDVNSLKDISNVKAITNYANLYRIRVGNYRLLVSHKRNTIEISYCIKFQIISTNSIDVVQVLYLYTTVFLVTFNK